MQYIWDAFPELAGKTWEVAMGLNNITKETTLFQFIHKYDFKSFLHFPCIEESTIILMYIYKKYNWNHFIQLRLDS